MNERGFDALVAAALSGQRQIRGKLSDTTGLCALGVLYDTLYPRNMRGGLEANEDDVVSSFELSREASKCPDCEAILTEASMLVHLNDVHEWDFLTIARKLREITQ